MKISYAITVCREFLEIQRLVHFLLRHKRIQDNIVILFDEANGDPEVETFLRAHSINGLVVRFICRRVNNQEFISLVNKYRFVNRIYQA